MKFLLTCFLPFFAYFSVDAQAPDYSVIIIKPLEIHDVYVGTETQATISFTYGIPELSNFRVEVYENLELGIMRNSATNLVLDKENRLGNFHVRMMPIKEGQYQMRLIVYADLIQPKYTEIFDDSGIFDITSHPGNSVGTAKSGTAKENKLDKKVKKRKKKIVTPDKPVA